jgi:hypothetical protein
MTWRRENKRGYCERMEPAVHPTSPVNLDVADRAQRLAGVRAGDAGGGSLGLCGTLDLGGRKLVLKRFQLA